MFKGREGSDQSVDIETLIGPGTVIEGDIQFRGGLHVDGTVLGSITASGDDHAVLTISQDAQVTGQVQVPVVIVDGQMEGDIVSTARVELSPNARISGNVHYRAIQVEFGAQVSGRLVYDQAPTLKLSAPSTDRDETEGNNQ